MEINDLAREIAQFAYFNHYSDQNDVVAWIERRLKELPSPVGDEGPVTLERMQAAFKKSEEDHRRFLETPQPRICGQYHPNMIAFMIELKMNCLSCGRKMKGHP